MNKTVRFIYIF